MKLLLLTLTLQTLVCLSLQFAVPNCQPTRLDGCTGQLLRMVKSNVPVPDTVEKVQTHCA